MAHPRHSWLFLVIACLFLPAVPADDASGCPVPTSPNCRVDCTGVSWDILCVDRVDFLTLRNDLQTLAGNQHSINVFLWNLNNPGWQIDSNLFGSSGPSITRLSVNNVIGLRQFPNLLYTTNLESLYINGAPHLVDFTAETLPGSLQSISLINTGIQRLEIDFNEFAPNMTLLTSFTVGGADLNWIQPKFFAAFPEIKTINLVGNRFKVTSDTTGDGIFNTFAALDSFVFKNNDFSATSTADGTDFLQKTLESLNLHGPYIDQDQIPQPASVVDLSNNGLVFNGHALRSLKLLNVTYELNIRGNPIENFLTITDLFMGFMNLRRLDVSATNLPTSRGTFSHLPKLDTLRLASNKLSDMTAVDMFADSQSTLLRVLDLSNNALTALPEGQLETIGGFLEELDLTGNNLLPRELGVDLSDGTNTTSDKPTFSAFPSLKYLGLSNNNWTTFDGSLLSPLKRLTMVDLSCNMFDTVSDDYFTDMPDSLTFVNMSMCKSENDEPVEVNDNALNAVPPNVTILELSKGNFRNWIFERLHVMTNETLGNMENLLLQENMIRFLDSKLLSGFPHLKVLNLRANLLQSLANASFRNIPSLETLIVSYNQIVKIENNDFEGLIHLRQLDLSGNKIAHIESGSFDQLSSLTNLYLGLNFLTGLDQVFVANVPNLIHLGIQQNPVLCFKRVDLDPLTGLKWLYVHDVTTPIFIDWGDSGSLRDKIYANPVASGDKLDCDPRYDSPLLHSAETTNKMLLWETDFIRLPVNNPWDLTTRNFVAHFAKCYIPQQRNISLLTSNLLCSMGDSKTAGMAPRVESSLTMLVPLLLPVIAKLVT